MGGRKALTHVAILGRILEKKLRLGATLVRICQDPLLNINRVLTKADNYTSHFLHTLSNFRLRFAMSAENFPCQQGRTFSLKFHVRLEFRRAMEDMGLEKWQSAAFCSPRHTAFLEIS